MFASYLKIALRNLQRHPGYAILNTAGLAIGLACCTLILLFVRDELLYDRFHEKAERIYRVYTETRLRDEAQYGAHSASVMGETVQAAFPEVEQIVRVMRVAPLVQRQDRADYEEHVYYAEATLFEVFDFRLQQGDAETALSAPFTVVLTPAIAQKYFGRQDPIGQVLQMEWWGEAHEVTITGIVEPAPANSHLQFDLLLSYASYETLTSEQQLGSWFSTNPMTYLLLRDGTDWRDFQAKMQAFIQQHVAENFPERDIWFTYFIQPLTDIHLNRLGLKIKGDSDLRYVYIFSIVAVLILLIACINYMNLATARAAKRAKEVGVRKVVGAGRGQLGRQFLADAVLFSLAAFVLGAVLTEFLLPLFDDLTGKVLVAHIWDDPVPLGMMLGASLATGLLAGSYPAFVLSGYQPIAVLRGTLRIGGAGGGLRKGLVIGQFACGVTLIIGTLVIVDQLRFMRETRLGFDQEQVVVVPLRSGDLRLRQAILKEELVKLPGVRAATVGMAMPGENSSGHGIKAPGMEASTVHPVLAVDTDYDDVLGLDMTSGRWFESAYPTDSMGYVVNETAARTFGLDDPLGQELDRNGNVGPIIGVVEDYHFASLHEDIKPLVIFMGHQAWDFSRLGLKLEAGRVPEALAALEAAWERLVPGEPFTYSFLDEDLAHLYTAEQRLGKIFGAFAFLGIFVACLGLFGLAAFTAEQRTKEIGVRKVLGATVPDIVTLLSRDFLLLVTVAFIVAAPIAYILMDRWLDDFAYRVELGLGVFALAGVLVLVIALLTVAYQAIRAALANPVKSLRYE